jgi:hypothetical protein
MGRVQRSGGRRRINQIVADSVLSSTVLCAWVAGETALRKPSFLLAITATSGSLLRRAVVSAQRGICAWDQKAFYCTVARE